MKTLMLLVAVLVGCAGREMPETFSVDPALSEDQAVIVRDVAARWCDAVGYCPTEVAFTGPDELGAVVWDADYARHGRVQGSSAFNEGERITLDANGKASVSALVFRNIVTHEWGHYGIERHTSTGLMARETPMSDAMPVDVDNAAIEAWLD